MRNPKRITEMKNVIVNHMKKFNKEYSLEISFPTFLVLLLNVVIQKSNVYDIFFPEDDNWLEWIKDAKMSEMKKEYDRDSLTYDSHKSVDADKCIKAFFDAWRKVPDWRFGQFISNSAIYLDESKFIESMNKYME